MPSKIKLPKGGYKTADILDMYWVILGALESKTDSKKDILDKHAIEAAYRQLNAIGYTDAKPQWLR